MKYDHSPILGSGIPIECSYPLECGNFALDVAENLSTGEISEESMAWNCYEEFWKESELCQQTCFQVATSRIPPLVCLFGLGMGFQTTSQKSTNQPVFS